MFTGRRTILPNHGCDCRWYFNTYEAEAAKLLVRISFCNEGGEGLVKDTVLDNIISVASDIFINHDHMTR